MAFDPISPTLIDSMNRAFRRLLLQFQDSPVLVDTLQAFIDEIQELQDAIYDVIKLRGPADATNVQLDGIGRIVGQERSFTDYLDRALFTPDVLDAGPDSIAVAWVTGAPLFVDADSNDEVFRLFIEAKVSRNFAQYGSVPELKAIVEDNLGYYIGFIRTGLMDVGIVVKNSTPRFYVDLFSRFEDTQFVDKKPYLPYAETVRITGVTFIPDDNPFFAPDLAANAADIGFAAVEYTL